MIAELLVGLAAVAAAAYVGRGLTRDTSAHHEPAVSDATARKARALDAILDLESEVAAGKLSEEDFSTFKTAHAQEALAAIREMDVAAAAGSDELELEIAAARERLR